MHDRPFPPARSRGSIGALIAAIPTEPRVAKLQLRGAPGRLTAPVAWPPEREPGALAVVFAADTMARAICLHAGCLVLAPQTRSLAFADAMASLEWAADHGPELGVRSGRLAVAGQGYGAAHAARLALHARDQRWRALDRQLLVFPRLDACDRAADLRGLAPATEVPCHGDDGREYEARLRAAGVAVEEIRADRRRPA